MTDKRNRVPLRQLVYGGIRRFFILPSNIDVHPEIEKNFKRNFIANASDNVFWAFGESMAAYNTIIPVYFSLLSSNPVLIGLIPAIRDAGWYLPQLFLAPIVERLDRKLPLLAKFAFVERLPFLALAIAAFWLPNLPQNTAVIIFLVIWIWKSLAAGISALPWQEMIAKVIPVSHRGRFFGYANLIGSLARVVGASLAGVILANIVYPKNYTLSFFLAFVGVVISYICLLFNREPAIKINTTPREHSKTLRQKIIALLVQDINFRRYLIGRHLNYISMMAYGFIAVYAISKYGLDPAYSATFAAIISAASIFGYWLWGVMGDKFGHKRVILTADIIWMLSLVLLYFFPSIPVIYLVFTLIGFAIVGDLMGDLNLVMELGNIEERPMYIGMARTLIAPILLLAPLVGGLIVKLFDYPVMIGISLLFSVLNVLFFGFKVEDPRQKTVTAETAVRI